MILVDTNVWLRIEQPDTELGRVCLQTIRRLKEEGETLLMCAQTMIEFWTVASRPLASNGLGMDPSRIETAIRSMFEICTLLPEPADIGERWLALAKKCRPIGKRCHDLRIAALALANGVHVILTLNEDDFRGISGVEVRTPNES